MDAHRGTFARAARTLAAAVAICAAVGGGSFALEAAVLGKPARSALVAAAILRRLDEFRLVDSTDSIDGRRFHGVCYEGWFLVGSGRHVRKERGAGLLLGRRTRIVEAGGSIFLPRTRRRLARAELRLDCPRVLDDAIAFRLARGAGVQLRRARGDYDVRIRTRREQIDYLVSPATLVAVGADVRAPWISARSVLRDGGLTKRELAALRRDLGTRLGRRWAKPA